MAVIKRMSSKATVGKLEKYLKQEEKTEDKLVSALNCDSDNFAKQCQVTNLLYGKNQKENERKYYHIVQSFSPKDNENLTHEQAHKIGLQFAEKNFKGFEVLVVTHKDKEHVHNHFVVNSVSLENGKKYRADNKSLWKMRRDSNELCKENNLVHSIQELGKRTKEKISSGELRKTIRGEDVWKTDLKAQINETSNRVTSKEQFKKEMLEKYKVEVQERTRKSKGRTENIYEYKPQGNRKFCPENRLGTEYGKENVDGIIRRNEEKARGNNTGVKGAEPNGKYNGIDTRNIETSIRDSQQERIIGNIELGAFERERAEQELTRQDKDSQRFGERERGIKEPTRERTEQDQER